MAKELKCNKCGLTPPVVEGMEFNEGDFCTCGGRLIVNSPQIILVATQEQLNNHCKNSPVSNKGDVVAIITKETLERIKKGDLSMFKIVCTKKTKEKG